MDRPTYAENGIDREEVLARDVLVLWDEEHNQPRKNSESEAELMLIDWEEPRAVA